MTIELSPELEQFIQDRVASGLYGSASDVVQEGLRLLREREETHHLRLEELKRDLRVGLAQLDAGRTVVLDEETREGIKRRGRERLGSTPAAEEAGGS
jgi:antitoxin ParD1/3/4